MAAFRSRLQGRLEGRDPGYSPPSQFPGDPILRDELLEEPPRLPEVLDRLVPEAPVVGEEGRDMPRVDDLAVSVSGRPHLMTQEDHDEVHEVFPADGVDLQLFEDQVGQ